MNIKIVVHPEETGGYWAEVPALPGCVSQGETRDEMERNIREAIQCHLDLNEDEIVNFDQPAEILELAL